MLSGGRNTSRAIPTSIFFYIYGNLPSSYAALKKQIYQYEKQTTDWGRTGDDVEANVPLMGHSSVNESFTALLDRELNKIKSFYEDQERELLDELDELEKLVASKEADGLSGDPHLVDDDEDEDEDEEEEEVQELNGRRDPSISRGNKRQTSTGSSKRVKIGEFSHCYPVHEISCT